MTSFRDWLQNKLLGYKEEEDYNMLTAGTRDAILAEIEKRLPKEREIYGDEINQYIDKSYNNCLADIRKVLLG